MPDETLSEAVKEAYVVARADTLILETLELSHALIGSPIYLVRSRKNRELTLETAATVTFIGCGFRFKRPPTGESGIQELSVSIDNVDRRINAFIKTVKESSTPVTMKWRPYLADDPSTPQLDPPLVLYLRDVVCTTLEVTGRATFADIVNKRFPTKFYTRLGFPSLGN